MECGRAASGEMRKCRRRKTSFTMVSGIERMPMTSTADTQSERQVGGKKARQCRDKGTVMIFERLGLDLIYEPHRDEIACAIRVGLMKYPQNKPSQLQSGSMTGRQDLSN